MKDKLKIELLTQEHIFGSSNYTTTVKITNISDEKINNLEVSSSLIAGRELQNKIDPLNIEINELKDKKRRLINELEQQVQMAYSKQTSKKLPIPERIFFNFIEFFDIYASLFSIGRATRLTFIPIWAMEAMKIDNWKDVLRLEKEIINNEEENSSIKKTFIINKEKLSDVLASIGSTSEEFKNGVDIEPYHSISFPFYFKAPLLFRGKNFDVQFNITYEESINNKKITTSYDKKIYINPSSFAIPTGGMLGGAIGYFIKATLIAQKEFTINWSLLFGSILLGFVLSLITAKNPNSNKSITVEDFTGGLIIGTLAGMFSDTFIEKMKLLIK